jgi:predicted HAD superfamily Cof-like phosphohydrolase
VSRLQEQVAVLHREFGHPIGDTPHVPPNERVRLRICLIAEEFFELLGSVYTGDAPELLAKLQANAAYMIDHTQIQVDLPALADALADLDYVVEGCRLEFGIDGGPVADEVHRTNMAKKGGGKTPKGKTLKPAGWQPPDIAGVLARQGSLRAKLLGPG